MAGMLTVVNPRRRRKNAAKRSHNRRRRRPRRHSLYAMNPRRHRRLARRHNARRHHRRRRHHNPRILGGVMGTLTKGLAIGAGAVAANVATNAVNYMLKGGAKGTGTEITGAGKIALKAGIGIIALPMLLKFVPGAKKFAGPVAIGAGVAVFLDIWDQYIKTNLPSYLQDYQYGALNSYQTGELNGWMPQEGVSGLYEGGAYG